MVLNEISEIKELFFKDVDFSKNERCKRTDVRTIEHMFLKTNLQTPIWQPVLQRATLSSQASLTISVSNRGRHF